MPLAAADSTQFWTEVTALATSGAVIAALIVASVTWWLQGRWNRRAARLDSIWRLMEYWDSERMWMMRAKAAREIQKRDPTSDMIDVLGFFEHLGYLLRKKWIDTESAWVMFSDWALPYWQAANYAIADDQRKDPTLWEEFAYLNDLLIEFEKNKWRRTRRSYPGVTADNIDELLHGEMRLWPGRPQWRRWWQR